MAGVFDVMACAVRSMDREDVDPAFMDRLAKMVTAEMVTSKVTFLFLQQDFSLAVAWV